MIQCILIASSAPPAQTLVSGTQPGATSTEEGTEYTEWVARQRNICIRHFPSQDLSHLSEHRIEKEEHVVVVEERHIDDMLYLRLADGRGWLTTSMVCCAIVLRRFKQKQRNAQRCADLQETRR